MDGPIRQRHNRSLRGGRHRRDFAAWPVRGGLAIVVGILGYVSVTQTIANVLLNRPAIAHGLAPNNAQAGARLAIQFAGPNAVLADRKHADAIARHALRQDATAVEAVSALGLNAEVRGVRPQARRLFLYSQALSRRFLPAQLWAIEEAVARDDIQGALHHYDIGLRTNGKSADLLYPVLASATSDPKIRSALVRTMTGKPNWGETFVTYMTAHGPDSRSTADLFLKLQRAGVTIPASARSPAIAALVADGFLNDAWSYYRSAKPSADRRTSRDPRFTDETDAPSLFDWVPVDDGSVTASVRRGRDGGEFDFAAPASVGGPLLSQMQLLPVGSYRLVGHSNGIEQEGSARPYWVLTCGQKGREIGRVQMPNSSQAQGRFMGDFNVPADCPMQMLTLVARPSDDVDGLSGQVDYVQLAPAR